VRVPVDLFGRDEEEELTVRVVGVVPDDRVLLHEATLVAHALESEHAARQVAPLLRPHSLEFDGSELPPRLEAEIPRGKALGNKARRGQVEGDVPDLDPLKDVVGLALVEDVDPVGGLELARLVEVDVDVDPVGDGAGDVDVEEEVGAELGQDPRAAAPLELALAGTEAVPVALDLRPGLDTHPEVRPGIEQGPELGRRGIGRLRGRGPGGAQGRIGGEEPHALRPGVRDLARGGPRRLEGQESAERRLGA